MCTLAVGVWSGSVELAGLDSHAMTGQKRKGSRPAVTALAPAYQP